MHTHHRLTGKELLIGTLKHQKMPAVAWVPFAGIHAGKLKNYTALEILTDGNKLLESLLAVNQVYDPDGQPVLFDLQVEAEILGCNLAWAQDAPPSVASHPLADQFVIPSRLPEKTDGRLPMILKVMREMKAKVGDHTALYGLVTGPFTLASHLRGTELFMDMVDNEEDVRMLLDYCKKVCIGMAEMYVEAGMDVIAVVDPVISQISPRHFKRFMSAPFSEVFTAIRQMGVLSSFFVCGDATKNIEVMCQTNPDSISIDENIDMVKAKEITDRYNICIGGNIPLTTRMLLGTQQDNMKYVVDLLAQLDPHNLIISPGCDMPYAVPIENTVGVLQAVREPEATRQLLANYHAIESDLDITLPDYAHLPRPLVEVFTIDSATCAACGYMKRIAERACSELNGKIDMVEYKITQPENIARIKKMGISHLPALAVNGEIKFLSVIPSIRELLEEIRKVM